MLRAVEDRAPDVEGRVRVTTGAIVRHAIEGVMQTFARADEVRFGKGSEQVTRD